MRVLKFTLVIAVISLAAYGLATGTAGVIAPYLLLLMGLMTVVMGVMEFQKRNLVSLGLFAASFFVLAVGLYTL